MNQIPVGLDPLPMKTRKEVFLEEMNQVVLWAELVALIQPHARGAHQALGGSATISHRDDAPHSLPATVVEPE
jgi:IS5 family transposase